MAGLMEIYEGLLQKHGFQGWLPVAPIGSCSGDPNTPVYGVSPKNEKQKLEVIFGAILTQNTSWKNVEKAIIALNEQGLVDISKILKIDESRLAEIIRPSGYFNQKANRLKGICRFLRGHPIQRLRGMDMWEVRKLLLEVSGIGPETADSILLYALDKPIFVVDAYTRRMFSGLGLIKADAPYDEIQKFFMERLPNDARLFNEYHALIIAEEKSA
jgi:endonuclease-3 related protein